VKRKEHFLYVCVGLSTKIKVMAAALYYMNLL